MGPSPQGVTMTQIWYFPARRALLGALLVALMPHPLLAQRSLPSFDNWEPLDEIGGITAWFRKMSAEFARYVDEEKRAQLWRSVDKLRRALYQLEQDSVTLRDAIPDAAPSETERTIIGKQTSTLLETVRRIGESLREIGADLRLADPNEMWRVEERIYFGFRTRAAALSYVQRELERNSNGGPWEAPAIRERLNKGIVAIRDAQKAVVEFHGQLKS